MDCRTLFASFVLLTLIHLVVTVSVGSNVRDIGEFDDWLSDNDEYINEQLAAAEQRDTDNVPPKDNNKTSKSFSANCEMEKFMVCSKQVDAVEATLNATQLSCNVVLKELRDPETSQRVELTPVCCDSCLAANEILTQQLRQMQAQIDALTISTRQLVNLALYRPTWQSSQNTHYDAGRAVDGSIDSCHQTAMGDMRPWWAVDLGKPTHVYLVTVINFACCPERLKGFTVGLTNNPPNTMNPLAHGYFPCGVWDGAVAKSSIMPVRCKTSNTAFRYVVVFGTTEYLNIAEVEVYSKGDD